MDQDGGLTDEPTDIPRFHNFFDYTWQMLTYIQCLCGIWTTVAQFRQRVVEVTLPPCDKMDFVPLAKCSLDVGLCLWCNYDSE